MKIFKQNQNRSFLEKGSNNKKAIIKKIAQAFSFFWSIGALIAVIFAWIADILYV
ncbi:hypothetical protein [Flavobacterium fryxellicola]|uniref:hypothetical protein n=1 Tax=Flavobacterium fryxellicola TaxID=249352 RepID=UPI000AF519F8|nr:hypothetical protein [Flavobacterium fryxellicola]